MIYSMEGGIFAIMTLTEVLYLGIQQMPKWNISLEELFH